MSGLKYGFLRIIHLNALIDWGVQAIFMVDRVLLKIHQLNQILSFLR